jgi:hypothetical protein
MVQRPLNAYFLRLIDEILQKEGFVHQSKDTFIKRFAGGFFLIDFWFRNLSGGAFNVEIHFRIRFDPVQALTNAHSNLKPARPSLTGTISGKLVWASNNQYWPPVRLVLDEGDARSAAWNFAGAYKQFLKGFFSDHDTPEKCFAALKHIIETQAEAWDLYGMPMARAKSLISLAIILSKQDEIPLLVRSIARNIGGWNEMEYFPPFIRSLRAAGLVDDRAVAEVIPIEEAKRNIEPSKPLFMGGGSFEIPLPAGLGNIKVEIKMAENEPASGRKASQVRKDREIATKGGVLTKKSQQKLGTETDKLDPMPTKTARVHVDMAKAKGKR